MKNFREAREKVEQVEQVEIKQVIASVDVSNDKHVLELEVDRLKKLLAHESDRGKALELSHLKFESLFKERENECVHLRGKVESQQSSLTNGSDKVC